MKKLFVLFITMLIVCFSTACNTDTKPNETKQIGDSTVATGTTATETTAEEDTKPKGKATITEQVCFENDGIKVTAKSIEEDDIWGIGIKLAVENNSDKNITVGASEVIVNNCMITSLFSCQVAAEKKATDTLYLSSSSLESAGIENIGQIEIYFYVSDSSSYEMLYEAECTTIKTSLFDTMDTTVNDGGHELYNKDGIRIVGKYVDENTIWGSSVLLYIENKTAQNITVSCDDLSINGYMVTSIFSSTVFKDKYAIDNITILSSSLEENDITSIDDIELKFRIYNPTTYDTIAETEAISFSVN